MSWLNINQSLNSLKGQISHFASEVLSEGSAENPEDNSRQIGHDVNEVEEKVRNQELEITGLKKLVEELQAALQSERLARKNGVKDEDSESSWYWDPPPQSTQHDGQNVENQYKKQIHALQEELSNLKNRDTIDNRHTEEELSRLREENKNLTNNLEDLDNQHQLAMERLIGLKKELQTNFEVLKQEHEDLKNTNEEYGNEINTLLAKIKERDKEIEMIKSDKSDYETLYHKYQNLERVHNLLKENAEKFQEENQDLQEEVFRLQEQVTKLEHDIEIVTKNSESVPKEKYEELLKEIGNLKNRRNSNQVSLDEINIDDNAKSVIENLKREISELKHKLVQKDLESQDLIESKVVRLDKVMQLYNKYINFEIPLDLVGEVPLAQDMAVLYKLESVFKTVISFKKELDVLKHELSEKNLNINHLHNKIDDLTAENDFLTVDVQQFETELNEMKKNNEFLISEIAALKNTSKLEPIIETHEDNLIKLESELADCNKINKTFESKIRRIETELTEVQSEKSKLKEELIDLKDKYASMLSELESCKNQTNAVEELENIAHTEQAKKLDIKCSEIDELKKKLHSSNSKNEQLLIDLHISENDKILLTKQVDDLKNELSRKESTCKDLENVKLLLVKSIEQLESKLNQMTSDKIKFEDQVRNLQNEISLRTNISNEDFQDNTTKIEEFNKNLETSIKENLTLKESLEKLAAELTNIKLHEEELIEEINKMKNNSNNETETISELQHKIDNLNIVITNLQDANQLLLQKKVQLEAELSSNNDRIVNLEHEYESLSSDLKEKYSLIDSLNKTIKQNSEIMINQTQVLKQQENDINLKNLQITKLADSLSDTSEELNYLKQQYNNNREEIKTLENVKEKMKNELEILSEKLNCSNETIVSLQHQLKLVESANIEFEQLLESKNKEIKVLNQSIMEISEKSHNHKNLCVHNNECIKLEQENEKLKNEIKELQKDIVIKEEKITSLNIKYDQIEKSNLEYKSLLDNTTSEKAELINLVNLKHNESIQYHTEIQRLNKILAEQSMNYKKIIEEKENLLRNYSENCPICENLKMTLKEKDVIILNLSQNRNDYDGLKDELQKANETVHDLSERCNNLEKSLAIQLETVKRLTAENLQLSEKEQNAVRELERLRQHLVEMEENYTQELMTSEQKLTECQTRLQQVEERAKQTSTLYTSNSIRANQEVETLRNQIKLLEKQREDIQIKLSDAEDAKSRSEAALTNLQVVLEQFQLDKERDIEAATEKIRNKMESIKRENNALQNEIANLNLKLEESIAGLQAASRLGDQVETKSAQINDLKEQVRTLQMSVTAAEERYYKAISNQQDKVDKNLIKNLVINYVMTASNNSLNRTQVLRVLSTVLDFNQQECEKLGLVRSANATESLAAEFVKFLQNESKPRTPLPDMMGITAVTSRSITPTSRKNSTLGPHPTFELGHTRNTSSGSNNLLFNNIDNVDTLSQVSFESDREGKTVSTMPTSLDTGVNQPRSSESAILKRVLTDM